MTTPAPQRGVTLVELVMVITLVGLLASAGALLLSRTASTQTTGLVRLRMAAAADAASTRVARDVQAALPNSIRVTQTSQVVIVELIPVVDVGRYRSEIASDGSGDPLVLEDASDSSFDVLGPAVSVGAVAAELVLRNLGNELADAYTGNNRRGGLALANGGNKVNFNANGFFPQASGSNRFFLVNTPVTYICLPSMQGNSGSGQLWRVQAYGWHANQPTDLLAAPLSNGSRALVLDGISACSVAYGASLANMAVVNFRLTLQSNGESATLLSQIATENTP